jgi:hypothetical protein
MCAAAVTLAGCGSSPAAKQPAASDRTWRANAAIIVRQLQREIADAQLPDATPAAARAALHDESQLYGLVVSYSDFGGCREMVAAAGSRPQSAEHVDRLLVAGCRHLERSSALFTRAVKQNSGVALLAAGRESGRALPALVQAGAALEARR